MVLVLLLVIIFTVWMLIHASIRTAVVWKEKPEQNIANILMVLLIIIGGFIGAIIYFFICYLKSKNFR